MFQDRLVNDADRHWFEALLKKKINTDFKSNAETALGDKLLLYGDFIDPTTDVKLYIQFTNMDQVEEHLILFYFVTFFSAFQVVQKFELLFGRV